MKPHQPSTETQNPDKSAKPGALPRNKDIHAPKTDTDHARRAGADHKEPEREDDRSKPVAAHNQENRRESGEEREADEKNRPKNPRENH